MSSMTVAQPQDSAPVSGSLFAAAMRRPGTWALAITLLGFFLRVWQLEAVPPGFRDDELIETLVISRNILDGDIALYYPDASGHEPLYHMLNALFLAWFGPGALGIRLVSALVGTITIPLTYVVGRKLFGPAVALAAAGALAVSFWGLMYSRVGIRHVLTPPFALAAFAFFWQGLKATASPGGRLPGLARWFGPGAASFLAAGISLGLGFYVYFAGRGVPLVPVAFTIYLALVAWPRFRAHWRGVGLMLAVALILALPLAWAIGQQPEAEGRVGELALPLIEAQAGNFGLIIQHTIAALSTAHRGGDPEWLYNLPGRPVFGPIGAVFFWAGVGIAVVLVARSLIRRLQRPGLYATDRELAAAFLLIWWLVGISPAILSVPEASLGHMIMAQSAFYMLAALPVGAIAVWARLGDRRLWLAALAGAVLIGAVALRDLPDYFARWPERGMVRFLYRADVVDVARFVRRDAAHPDPADFGITGLLAGPWDREALAIALDNDPAIRPRWYNPERALLVRPDISFGGYPEVTAAYASYLSSRPESAALSGGYSLMRVDRPPVVASDTPVCFVNNLCWTGSTYSPAAGTLDLLWEARDRLILPPLPLISNPPPPGVYNGPRLYAFAQWVDESGAFLAGDDGLWVDPSTLFPGDVFVQQHRLPRPEGEAPDAIRIGLYDPLTGERVLTEDGADYIELRVGD